VYIYTFRKELLEAVDPIEEPLALPGGASTASTVDVMRRDELMTSGTVAFLTSVDQTLSQTHQENLLKGEVLLTTRSHSAWGGAVTAQMYVPLSRSHVWQQVTDYPRWVQFFPDLVQSEVLSDLSELPARSRARNPKRLYQVASKAFWMLSVQVEIYLKVVETIQPSQQQIQFCLEKGNFSDFTANLNLQDYRAGTVLTYSVAATPTIPVPSQLIQQAMRLDLPANMRKMRQVLCGQ
jgi:Polyketide cyclase / dehydrase and lipid transport